MIQEQKTDEIALTVLMAGAVEMREVPQKIRNAEVDDLSLENQPFLYASGNWGPGYVSIKGLVGHGELMPHLVEELVAQTQAREWSVDFIAGNITGGIIPGWLLSQALDIPFVYVSGTRRKDAIEAPLTMIDKDVLAQMTAKLYRAILKSDVVFNFIAGLVPGGMIPGFQLSRLLSCYMKRVVPFVYIREARKTGGQKEIMTGIRNNPYITPGDTVLVISQVTDFAGTVEKGITVLQEEGFNAIDGADLLGKFEPNALNDIGKIEIPFREVISQIPKASQGMVLEELVNFCQTTCFSVDVLRKLGYRANLAGTLLFYDNPEAIRALNEHKVEMAQVFALPELIAVAEKHQTHSQKAIDDYRTFLTNPLEWQANRGLTRVEKGGTQ